MLIIKTYLDKSNIQGIGLFAEEYISAKTIVWKFDPNIDIVFDPEIIKKYPVLDKYHWKEKDGSCLVPIDDDKFINHSRNPNLICFNDVVIAKHAIIEGAELLIDYREIMPESEWEDYY